VGGTNPTITLNAGDVLVAGYLNSVAAGVVRLNSAATGNAIDYTALVNTLPSSVPNPLTANASLTLNRTLQYNVGFDVVPVPEPSMMSLGLVGLALIGRRQRRRA
jgi:MYXO-CTERM domain-containing protein